MSLIKYCLFLYFIFLLSVNAEEKKIPIVLDRLVSIEQQKTLGLDNLSPEQRAGITRLLLETYQLGIQEGRKGTEIPKSRAPETAPAQTVAPSAFESQIDGDFEGWEGETIVKLVNGEIWQQTEYHYTYHYAFMPKAIIFKTASGYKMKVDGIDKAIGVQKLK